MWCYRDYVIDAFNQDKPFDNQLGFDPDRLTCYYNGLDQRLVGVEGADVIEKTV